MTEQVLKIEYAPDGSIMGAHIFFNAEDLGGFLNGKPEQVNVDVYSNKHGIVVDFGIYTPMFKKFAQDVLKDLGKDKLIDWAKKDKTYDPQGMIKEMASNILKATASLNAK